MKVAAFLPNQLFQRGDSSAPHTNPGLPALLGTDLQQAPPPPQELWADALTGLKDTAPAPEIRGL